MPGRRTESIGTFSFILGASTLLRVGLILYSEWYDARSLVKYTDVDYRVFTDAAHFLMHPGMPGNATMNIARGRVGTWLGLGDPYTRETYRYTPLLAVLVTPNEWLHPSFGKYLFAACDLLAGVLLRQLLVHLVLPAARQDEAEDAHPSGSSGESKVSPVGVDPAFLERWASLLAAVHLLNPMVFAISTRGSSEAILLLLVLLALGASMRGHWTTAAVWLGVAAHWKIYPAVYGVACVGVIGAEQGLVGIRRFVNGRAIRFTVVSAGTFFALGAACYAVWGYPFLYESYLYHLHRKDHRHNFSPYFYLAYLSSTPSTSGTSLGSRLLRSPLASFGPQLCATIGAGVLFSSRREHFPLAWFTQTAAFVLFNKVCTSQYFLWYLLFIPLLVPRLQRTLTRTRALALVVVWAVAQALWLERAAALEFTGVNAFRALWARGLAYVAANAWVLGEVLRAYCV